MAARAKASEFTRNEKNTHREGGGEQGNARVLSTSTRLSASRFSVPQLGVGTAGLAARDAESHCTRSLPRTALGLLAEARSMHDLHAAAAFHDAPRASGLALLEARSVGECPRFRGDGVAGRNQTHARRDCRLREIDAKPLRLPQARIELKAGETRTVTVTADGKLESDRQRYETSNPGSEKSAVCGMPARRPASSASRRKIPAGRTQTARAGGTIRWEVPAQTAVVLKIQKRPPRK